MAEHNPYQPPLAALADPEPDLSELASRGERLGAALVDIGGATLAALGSLIASSEGGEWSLSSDTFDANDGALLLLIAPYALWQVLQLTLLWRSGQSVGKRLLGLKVVDILGEDKPGNLLLMRGLLPLLVYWALNVASCGLLPLPALILDSLFIFRKDRRCLHDLVAGTRVVRIRPR